MKGDFTRRSYYDLKKPYTGVLKQQGRVDLDSDWNDYVAIQDHLRHTALKDLVGPCGVPYPSQMASAEDGFRIELSFTDKEEPYLELKLAAGRIYVDGMLCELGDELTQTYKHQESNELYKCQPKEEEPQCDLRLPDAFSPVAHQTDLLYLEVWQRHVTAIEDPDIREIALGGPDTTTRVETVWRLKVEPNVGAVTHAETHLLDCDDAINGWPPPESNAFLTTSVEASSEQPTDPCDIGAEGGYRGLENRLYRVEIHQGGGKDEATFKWSRDNGSVVYGVKAISGKTVELEHVGRDRELSLQAGDWVEVLDDNDELSFAGSILAKITDIDLSKLTVTLNKSIPNEVRRYFRLRRWDQGEDEIKVISAWSEKPRADSAGMNSSVGTPYELENGIRIGFSGGVFKAGDYWVFPARTATGKIDELKQEFPHGIERHYCKLALLTWRRSEGVWGVDVQDCRQRFRPLTELTPMTGCCTVRVGKNGDFSNLQTAIDSLSARGGEVCLLPGDHYLRASVRINQDYLTITGCGRHARIVGPLEGPAFLVEKSHGIRFENLWVETASVQGVMSVSFAQDIVITDCRLLNTDRNRSLSIQSDGVHITGSVLKGGIWIRDGSSSVRIMDNVISDGNGAGVTLCGQDGEEYEVGSRPTIGVVAVTVQGNRIQDMDNSGIANRAPLADLESVVIVDNLISNCARQGPQRLYHHNAVGGIVLHEAEDVRIHGNTIIDNGVENDVLACGVFVDECQGLEVVGNTIRNNGVAGSVLIQGVDFTTMQAGEGKNPRRDQELILAAADNWQAGIVALFVTGRPGTQKTEQTEMSRLGNPAARIHDNTVSCPSGHTLVLAGLGQFSVANNALTTYGLRTQPLEGTELAHGVAIINWGVSPEFAAFGFPPSLGVGARVHFERWPTAAFGYVQPKILPPSGRTLFHGNQITLQITEANVGPALSAAAFLTYGDLSLEDNQFDALYPGGILGHGVAVGTTLRASGNRFSELPDCAYYSYAGMGLLNTATSNQTTHCLWVDGWRTIEQNNLSALCALEESGE